MSKKQSVHLICNAHLDPVWLWQFEEGAAEAISTFRVAADFCEENDGFVFNHNEVILYEWVGGVCFHVPRFLLMAIQAIELSSKIESGNSQR